MNPPHAKYQGALQGYDGGMKRRPRRWVKAVLWFAAAIGLMALIRIFNPNH